MSKIGKWQVELFLSLLLENETSNYLCHLLLFTSIITNKAHAMNDIGDHCTQAELKLNSKFSNRVTRKKC